MLSTRNINLPDGCMGLPIEKTHFPCIVGIDVRYGSYDVAIADLVRNPKTERNILRPVFYGKVRDDLETLFLCRQYRVKFGLIDCRPEATLAKRMQGQAETMGIELWLAQYNPSPGGTIEMTRNEGEKLVTLERTMTMDCVHHAFQVGQAIILPQNYIQVCDGKLANELKNTTRIPYRSGNRDCWIWEKTGDDHAFHAFNLLFAALKLSGLENWSTEVQPQRGEVISANDHKLALAAAGMEQESVYFES